MGIQFVSVCVVKGVFGEYCNSFDFIDAFEECFFEDCETHNLSFVTVGKEDAEPGHFCLLFLFYSVQQVVQQVVVALSEFAVFFESFDCFFFQLDCGYFVIHRITSLDCMVFMESIGYI